MRLLLTEPPQPGEPELRLEEFSGNEIPNYVILSHVWSSPKDEVQYADVDRQTYSHKPGIAKVRGAIHQARRDGYRYVWIDSVCIDKSSSAELSEAINSMFRWYSLAAICYVYLVDVTSAYVHVDNIDPSCDFFLSKWWTRGWTLQEVLAPSHVWFFSSTWIHLGDKVSLQTYVTAVTTIDAAFIKGTTSIRHASIAKRMSWASRRMTTRAEDTAYCLLGLFSVNMPMLYGEGSNAFRRLQEEIIKGSDDQTIFAWSTAWHNRGFEPLADHPGAFSGSSNFVPHNVKQEQKPFAMTNMGLKINVFMDHATHLAHDTGIREPVFHAAIACAETRATDARSQDKLRTGLSLRPILGSRNQFTRVNLNTVPQPIDVISDAKIRRVGYDRFYENWFLRKIYIQPDFLRDHPGRALDGTHDVLQINHILDCDAGTGASKKQGKSFTVIDRRVVLQYDSHVLPSVKQDYAMADSEVFLIGQARLRVYGIATLRSSCGNELFSLLLGRLLDGDLGFGVCKPLPETLHEAECHVLYPAGSWMLVPPLEESTHEDEVEICSHFAKVDLEETTPQRETTTLLVKLRFQERHGHVESEFPSRLPTLRVRE